LQSLFAWALNRCTQVGLISATTFGACELDSALQRRLLPRPTRLPESCITSSRLANATMKVSLQCWNNVRSNGKYPFSKSALAFLASNSNRPLVFLRRIQVTTWRARHDTVSGRSLQPGSSFEGLDQSEFRLVVGRGTKPFRYHGEARGKRASACCARWKSGRTQSVDGPLVRQSPPVSG